MSRTKNNIRLKQTPSGHHRACQTHPDLSETYQFTYAARFRSHRSKATAVPSWRILVVRPPKGSDFWNPLEKHGKASSRPLGLFGGLVSKFPKLHGLQTIRGS